MTQIVVSPERLEAVSSMFSTQKAETENILNLLISSMNDLEAEWEGMAQNKFYMQWNEMMPKMTQFTSLLEEISLELRRIATVFRQTDQHVI